MQDIIPRGRVNRREDDICFGSGGGEGGFYGCELGDELGGLVCAREVQEVVDLVFGEAYRGCGYGRGRGDGGHGLVSLG